MDIGTAKPDAATLKRAPHHLINIIDPHESYSAARFRDDALTLMREITERGNIPLLVGGTMLYFKALVEGLNELPAADPVIRLVIETMAEEGDECATRWHRSLELMQQQTGRMQQIVEDLLLHTRLETDRTRPLREEVAMSALLGDIVMGAMPLAERKHQTLTLDCDAAVNPLQGQHPYDVSKTAADLIAYTYAKSYGLPVAITRCGNFYGGGDLNWNRIVPGTIRSVLRGLPPVIRSDGEYIRDYFYVEDGAAAYMLLAEQLALRADLVGQAFNLSNENQVSVREIVERILKIMDAELVPEIRNEVSNEIRHQYLSAEKARRLLQWEPLFSLDEGLQKTISWYKDFFDERTG